MPHKEPPATHASWDLGTIDQAFEDVFGRTTANKVKPQTTQTLCGQRVAIDRIDNENPTCKTCQKERRTLEIDVERVKALIETQKHEAAPLPKMLGEALWSFLEDETPPKYKRRKHKV